jgi:hypothetical protein
MSDLPTSVYALIENKPVEDIILAILREGLPDVSVVSLIPQEVPEHFVLVRRLQSLGDWHGDPRFTDEGRFAIHTYTADPDGDYKGAILSEAVRVVLRNASLHGWRHPDLGSVIEIAMVSEPTRATDWSTSTGPVQYADLPTGYWRYQSSYTLSVRRPRKK